MVEVQRRKGESFESFYRRFQKRLFLSGKLLEVRKNRFKKQKPTRRDRQQSALRRSKIASKIDYLKRIGKFDDKMEVSEILKR